MLSGTKAGPYLPQLLRDEERSLIRLVCCYFSAAGVPESGAVQEILFWQATTVRMMYSLIADAITAKGTPCAGLCVIPSLGEDTCQAARIPLSQ